MLKKKIGISENDRPIVLPKIVKNKKKLKIDHIVEFSDNKSKESLNSLESLKQKLINTKKNLCKKTKKLTKGLKTVILEDLAEEGASATCIFCITIGCGGVAILNTPFGIIIVCFSIMCGSLLKNVVTNLFKSSEKIAPEDLNKKYNALNTILRKIGENSNLLHNPSVRNIIKNIPITPREKKLS